MIEIQLLCISRYIYFIDLNEQKYIVEIKQATSFIY